MRKLLTAVLFATAVLTAPTANAVDDWAGFTCGFTSTNDPTGQIIQDPNTQTGEVNAGPWAVVNESGGTITDVTITCTIQINDAANPSVGGTSRTSTVAGNVGVLAETITYTAVPGDDIYLCTYVSWDSSKGHHDLYFDADADDALTGYVGAPGNQCSLAISVEGMASSGNVNSGPFCVWVSGLWACF